MTDALVATDVRKQYGDVDALAGVSLSVAQGEVFALVGPNGAGKTTLVRTLTGTTTPDSGSVSMQGGAPTDADPEGLGVLPQSFSPPSRLTAREVVAFYAGLYDDARGVDDVLDAVGVSGVADTHYEDLSGGEQRRVCLGSTLVNDPDVLFLDEPTTGIDPVGRRTVWDLIDDQVAGGTTVFLTTHDMREAERLADRVGLLAAGELVAVGAPAALVETHAPEPTVVAEIQRDHSIEGGEAGDGQIDSVDADSAGGAGDGSLVRARDALEAADYDVTVRGRTVQVAGVEAREVGAVADVLEAASIPFSGLTWSDPDLEDVYLAVTGESYAEDARSGARVERAAPPSANRTGESGTSARGGDERSEMTDDGNRTVGTQGGSGE